MIKKLICAVLVLTTLISLEGCGAENGTEAPYNAAFVLGITNNNPLVSADRIGELAGLASLPGSTYTCILASGEPSVICEGEIPDFSGKGYSSRMLERIEASVQADIAAQIDGAAPTAPEVDIAAATVLAVRCIHARQEEGRENLLVYCLSGISTSGLIDMTATSLSELDVESSVEKLKSALGIDMSGIDVIFYFCGDVSGDQTELSEREVSVLRCFYETLCYELGADSVTFMEDIPVSGSYDFDQSVTAIQTETTGSLLQTRVIDGEEITDEEAVGEAFSEGLVLSFTEETVGFLPDSTELSDPEAAVEALAYVLEYMKENPDFQLLVAGTTTSAGEEESSKVFSEARASAVQKLLEEAGIAQGRITVVGLGYSSEFYIPDRNEDGSLNGEICPLNRTVRLMDLNSETAARLLGQQ